MPIATSRDVEHAVVGGVCAGIASRYQYPVSRIRAATIALSVATAGIGGLAYLALWRVLPSTSKRLYISNSMNEPKVPYSNHTSSSSNQGKNSTQGTAKSTSDSAITSDCLSETLSATTNSALYGPVATDLPLVSETLSNVAQGVGFDFLETMLTQQLTGSGKMMRPGIALLAARLGSYDLDKVVPLAASVELLHSASLVHDDVIDEADERRGNNTANSLFGNSASVMLGDYMFANAAELIARTDNTQVVRRFAETLMMMVRGELTQDVTVFEYSEDVQRYLDRITGKTASLFSTAAEGGALVSDAPTDQIEAMRTYGLRLGVAFQIIDDVLDFTGDPEIMGKPVGSDLRSGTLTLPAILYMQQKPNDNPIKRAFEGQRRRANLDHAIEDILTSTYVTESIETAHRFGQEARENLKVLPAGVTRKTLDKLVDYVLERNS